MVEAVAIYYSYIAAYLCATCHLEKVGVVSIIFR